MSEYLLKDILYQLRTSHSYTQKFIADYLNMTRAAYGHYENGKRTPNYQTLLKLAKLYQVDINDFINSNTTPIPDDRLVDSTTYPTQKSGNNMAALLGDNHGSFILTKDEEKHLALYKMLSEKDKKKANLFIVNLIKIILNLWS
ncbi:MAG: transcriptional regulator, family [Anaerocolumna sp.]|nr:transcriptional regulator, family [Anaerocolumna sp.]